MAASLLRLLLLLLAASCSLLLLLPTPCASRGLHPMLQKRKKSNALAPLPDSTAQNTADRGSSSSIRLCNKCVAAMGRVEENQRRVTDLVETSLQPNNNNSSGGGGGGAGGGGGGGGGGGDAKVCAAAAIAAVSSSSREMRDSLDVLRQGMSRVNSDLHHVRFASRRSDSGLSFLRSDVAFLQSSVDSAARDIQLLKTRWPPGHQQGVPDAPFRGGNGTVPGAAGAATTRSSPRPPSPPWNSSSTSSRIGFGCRDVTTAVDRSSREVRHLRHDVTSVRKNVDVVVNDVAQIRELLSQTSEGVDDVKRDVSLLRSKWNVPLGDQDVWTSPDSLAKTANEQQRQQETLLDSMNVMKKSITTALFDLNRLKAGMRKSRKELGSIRVDVSFLRGFFQRETPGKTPASQKQPRHDGNSHVTATNVSQNSSEDSASVSDVLVEVRNAHSSLEASLSSNVTLLQNLVNRTETLLQGAIGALEAKMTQKLDRLAKKMDDMDRESNEKLDRLVSMVASLSAGGPATGKVAELKAPLDRKARDQAIEKSTANITLNEGAVEATAVNGTTATKDETFLSQAQAVACQESNSTNSTEEGALRLASQGKEVETLSAVGRVELFREGEWVSLCGATFDPEAARVACRELGLPTAFAHPIRGLGFFSLERTATLVNCSGEEARLRDCQLTEGACPSPWDAWLGCRGVPWVRLRGARDPREGRVEVLHQGEWGTVCDDGFSRHEAAVVCGTLGYPSSRPTVHSKARYGGGRGPIWMTEVRCPAWARSLEECGHAGWGAQSCTHLEDVGVECRD